MNPINLVLEKGKKYHTLTTSPSGHLVASGSYDAGDAESLMKAGVEVAEGVAPHFLEVMKVCPLCIKNAAAQSWHQEF